MLSNNLDKRLALKSAVWISCSIFALLAIHELILSPEQKVYNRMFGGATLDPTTRATKLKDIRDNFSVMYDYERYPENSDECVPGSSFEMMIEARKAAGKNTQGLETALANALAKAERKGEQLCLKNKDIRDMNAEFLLTFDTDTSSSRSLLSYLSGAYRTDTGKFQARVSKTPVLTREEVERRMPTLQKQLTAARALTYTPPYCQSSGECTTACSCTGSEWQGYTAAVFGCCYNLDKTRIDARYEVYKDWGITLQDTIGLECDDAWEPGAKHSHS